MIVHIVRLSLDGTGNSKGEISVFRTSFARKTVTDARKILDNYRRVTYRQIKETLCLNTSVIHLILNDHLHMPKLCARLIED